MCSKPTVPINLFPLPWSFSIASIEYECGALVTSDEEILVWNYYLKPLSIFRFILHFVGMMSYVRHDSITQSVPQLLVFLCAIYVTSYIHSASANY